MVQAPDLEAYKAHMVRAAKNLRYPKEIESRIWDASSEAEITRIMATYRVKTESEEDLQNDRYLSAILFKRRYRR